MDFNEDYANGICSGMFFPNELDFSWISHRFLGRYGGMSSGLYDSLNCSKFVGDDVCSVAQNLEIAKKSVGADKLITLEQVHGKKCIMVDEGTQFDEKADALVTEIPGIALGVLTADCAPVLFLDPEKKIIGAAHAGWRGACGGVLESTVETMVSLGASADNIFAAIGPCIHKNSYEVGEDFVQNFPDFDHYTEFFTEIDANNECCAGGLRHTVLDELQTIITVANLTTEQCVATVSHRKYLFDLPGYCKKRLKNAGVDKVSIVPVDTCKCCDDFFSYRVANKTSGGICGRNISLICMKKTSDDSIISLF